MDKEKEYKEDDECKEDSSTVNKNKEFKRREYKVEQVYIKQLLAQKKPIKFVRYVISTVTTCEQKTIEFGK